MSQLLFTLFALALAGSPALLLRAKREFWQTLVGAAALLFAAFLLVSLLSLDRSGSVGSNWGGPVGSWLAGGFALALGVLPTAGLALTVGLSGLFITLGRLSLRNYIRSLIPASTAFFFAALILPLADGVTFGLGRLLRSWLGFGGPLLLLFLLALSLYPLSWPLLRRGIGLLKTRREEKKEARKQEEQYDHELAERLGAEAEDSEVEGRPVADETDEQPRIVVVGEGQAEPREPEGGDPETEKGLKPARAGPPSTRTKAEKEWLLSLLEEPLEGESPEEEDLSELITQKLAEFRVEGKVVRRRTGPLVTQYEFEPAPGVKLSKVVSLADDLALRLKTHSIRIVAPLAGRGTIGIEVPNAERRTVRFKKLATSPTFSGLGQLAFTLGVDPTGVVHVENLGRMPHLLIAGTTGSGKSVGINTLIASLLILNDPSSLRLILIDPKRVEMTSYEGIPHLLTKVIKEKGSAAGALKSAVKWMEYRYGMLAKAGCRDIESFNRKAKGTDEERLPYIVIIIDEFADLMLTQGREVEEPLARLAQMARAVGIHLVVATQRPSVDVITGTIKANFPVRVAYKVPSRVDSRTILDETGAEKLLGKGDMLYIPPGTSEPERLHGPFISESEVRGLVGAITTKHLKERLAHLFGRSPAVERVSEHLVESGSVDALVRADEPGSYERLELVAEEVAVELGIETEAALESLTSLRDDYYSPIPEMEEAPVLDIPDDEESAGGEVGEHDPQLGEAARLIVRSGSASATLLQRKMKVGFARAARIMDQLEELGVIEPAQGTKARKPIITSEQLERLLQSMGLERTL